MTAQPEPLDEKFEDQYKLFRKQAERAGPDEQIKILRRMDVPEQLLARFAARYEADLKAAHKGEGPKEIHGEGRVRWYTGVQPGDAHWPKFRERLEGADWDVGNLLNLDDATDRVVGLLDPPWATEFATKGLVMGHVQSGKTTNFTGVIAKSADRGYRLFIILSGIHNQLRRQTQLRMVRDLINLNPERWYQLTDPEQDFQSLPNAPGYLSRYSNQTGLMVVKKNHRVLEKLISWLESAELQLREIPVLIIDDEADQAAVATERINPLVRRLLDVFPRAAYVGYTASPFANLLINPAEANDLYPRDFIVALDKPTGHFGTEVIFGRDVLDYEDPAGVDDGYDMIRRVPDDEVHLVRPGSRRELDGFAPSMTGELRRAVAWFLLATGVRRVRGTGVRHSTMLIHTSVNVAVHQSFKPVLNSYLAEFRDKLHGAEPDFLAALETLWRDESPRVPAEEFGEPTVAFEDVLGELPEVLRSVRVVLDNSRSDDRLDYDDEPQVAIAVGGNTLSRGLTLEGLVVSYFVRSVSAFDTLLQMGRWFGFRKGYADLPRIWMTDELRDWFRHIAGVEAEMRRDIERYAHEPETPLTLAVKIRTHPALRVTSAAKMQDAVHRGAAFGGRRVQTRYFRADDREWLEANASAAKQLVAETVDAKGSPESLGSGVLWRDVPVELILAFASAYEFHENAPESDLQVVNAYVRARNERGSLKKWNVALVGSSTANAGSFDFGLGVEIEKSLRSKLESSPAAAYIKSLMSRRDAALDLSPIPKSTVSEDEIFRLRNEQLPDHGLLTIYPIDARSEPKGGGASDPKNKRFALGAVADVIGAGFVFPQPDSDESVYVEADLSAFSPRDGYLERDDDSVLEEED